MNRDVYGAIADPTRREIIALLSKEALNLNAVAENFNISRPAISKHIKILTQCGLVKIKQEGRERICVAQLKSLQQVAAWVGQYQSFWMAKLDALEKHLAEPQKKNKRKLKK